MQCGEHACLYAPPPWSARQAEKVSTAGAMLSTQTAAVTGGGDAAEGRCGVNTRRIIITFAVFFCIFIRLVWTV